MRTAVHSLEGRIYSKGTERSELAFLPRGIGIAWLIKSQAWNLFHHPCTNIFPVWVELMNSACLHTWYFAFGDKIYKFGNSRPLERGADTGSGGKQCRKRGGVYEGKEKGALLSNRERGKERAPSSLPKERLSSCPHTQSTL